MKTRVTHVGLFRFKRVCFGLAYAPSAFQKPMSCALSDLIGLQCYLDDIVISSRNNKDYDANLHAVLKRLTEFSLDQGASERFGRIILTRLLQTPVHMIQCTGPYAYCIHVHLHV